jgi:hypothetical protein
MTFSPFFRIFSFIFANVARYVLQKWPRNPKKSSKNPWFSFSVTGPNTSTFSDSPHPKYLKRHPLRMDSNRPQG